MPILTGGVAVIPLTRSNAASALNNVVQRVSGALGLAMLTAILTTQRAQQLAGRAALLPATTPTPQIGGPTVPGWVDTYALYQQTQLQVFVGAIDDLFLISTGLSALGALVALLLRSGPAPPAGFGPVPAAPATSGEVTVEGHLVPSATATGNGRPPLQTDGPLDVGINAHPRDT
ncbi:MAG TPA: hypothetical protein VE155_08905, partial [Pseudonocardiaceae bacterium]|nr:hypothetical protein [Pseudonocardiaceae bacterium]